MAPVSAAFRYAGSVGKRRTNEGEIAMSKIDSRITMFAIIILSLAFAATSAGSAFAHERHSRMAPRADVRRHPGYASPVIQDCDLPSSPCSNDDRIAN
jgi:hypothetical protein